VEAAVGDAALPAPGGADGRRKTLVTDRVSARRGAGVPFGPGRAP
jgi:hypothetical protein